ncbi:N-methyl-L-tryptophan oxidase [Halobacteriales archaeon QH_8_64_26]|nr:MAG: N-methyl-L-tryptophan oxidase [Halobacteriales archaeon QH_8_64_26]
MHTTPERYDAIVIGVGGIGSAAVYRLAARGLDVLGLERFDVPHTRGSSHGSTRIVRLTQPEDSSYVPLARAAFEHWRDLERETGRELLTITGSVHAAEPDASFLDSVRASLDAHRIAYEELSGTAVNERFPGYSLPEDYEAVYQPDGGFVDCERAIVAHVEAAHAAGATIRARERVENWTETGEGIRVESDKGVYEADDLVLAAGAWTGRFLPDFNEFLAPTRHVMAWLQPRRPERFEPRNFPVFSLRGEQGSGYGFPVYDVPGFKFGVDPPAPTGTDPEAMDREPTTADETLHREFAETYFPDGAGPTMSLSTCLVTESVDGHFLLGSHPEHESVHVAAGFSGHGFKFSAVLGAVLADFVTENRTEHAIDRHRLERVFEKG